MSLAPGRRLGPYEVTSQIGVGGMGEVYRAIDANLKRAVAIKVLPSAVSADPERLARFQREAEVLATLNHPNIATIYGLEKSDGTTALAMELIEGPTLADRIEQQAFPLDEALVIARQIADALQAAHDQGVVHRDLKPANIKVRPDGTVKVLDFGLAKMLEPNGSSPNLTQSPTLTSPALMTGVGVLIGTAPYMSPEQAKGRPADKRSDIWAFGCVLYEMLTRKSAFSGETLTEIIAAVLKNDPDWDALPLATPDPVRVLLRRCLRKDPNRRLQHPGDARIELEEAIATPAVGSSTARTKQPRMSMSSMLPWAIVALVSIVLVTQLSLGRSGSAAPSVARLDLNMPAGVELATTGSPKISLSADGSRIAFLGGTSGVRRVYVRRFDDAEATLLRGTDTANSCFFSPDGRTIGFITSDRVLKKVSLGDGLVTTLVSDADHNIVGGAWTADDWIVFGQGGALWEVRAAGTESARQLTSLDQANGERAHAWPTLVSGGKAVLFTTLMAGPRMEMRIEAVVRATGQRHVVVDSGSYPMYSSTGHLVFFRDNALLAASFDADALAITGPPAVVVESIALDQLGAPMAALSSAGTLAYVIPGSATRRLVWVSRQGVESPINDTPRPYQNPRLAPDGTRIVVENAGGHLWLQDVTRSTFQPLTTPETIGNTYAAWSHDSKRVVFRTVAGLWVIESTGAGRPRPLGETSVSDIPTSVSPDGSTLAFIRQAGGNGGDLYTMPLDGASEPRPLVTTQGYDGGGQFSPDGRWMMYVSNESGQFEVYVRPYPGPENKQQVSTQGGTHARWNPSGKELFYRNGTKMMVVDVSTRQGELALSAPRVLFDQRYAFGGAQTVANYDVSPDGQRFVMVKDDSASGRLNVVLNWTEELKARVPLK